MSDPMKIGHAAQVDLEVLTLEVARTMFARGKASCERTMLRRNMRRVTGYRFWMSRDRGFDPITGTWYPVVFVKVSCRAIEDEQA